MSKVLVLHPGSMGGAIASCLTANRHEVHWVTTGRSPATAARAEAANATGHQSLATALAHVDVVISICPPDHAVAVAQAVAEEARETHSQPIFLDANAVAPITMTAIAGELDAVGCNLVDGGVVGPPPTAPGVARLFLSGAHTAGITTLFAGSNLECVEMDAAVGAASALKMTYAAWTKGSSALLLTIAAAAEAHGVADQLHAEWDRSQPGLTARVEATAARSAPKAWRWQGEMEEIAATMAHHRLPAGFHLAASDVWRRLADFKGSEADELDPADVLARLLQG